MLDDVIFWVLALLAVASGVMVFRFDSMARATYALLTSLLFGLGHAYQGLAGALLSGAIGLGYGAVFFAGRRNLWSSILTHGAYDTVGFVVVYMSWDAALTLSA